MDSNYANYHVQRILSGIFKIIIDEKLYYLKKNTKEDRFEAQEIYFESYRKAEQNNSMTLKESYLILAEVGAWTSDDEFELKKMPSKVSSLKFQIYKAFYSSKTRENLRKQLRRIERDNYRLVMRKNSLMAATCEGIASLYSNYYSLYTKLTDDKGRYLKEDILFNDLGAPFLEEVSSKHGQLRLDDSELRDLSREGAWRDLFSLRKVSMGIYDSYAADLTDEQVSLLSWSSFYESIMKSPEAPSEDIISDNDAVDGWIKEQTDKSKSTKSDVSNIKGSEVFIPVEDDEDIQRVNDMNDISARMTKRIREKAIDTHGTLKEIDLPDIKLDIQRQANEQFKERTKGGK